MNLEIVINNAFWIQLVATTVIQIALSADNLMVMSVQAAKLKPAARKKAINLGLLGAMVLRVSLLLGVTWLIQVAAFTIFTFDTPWLGGAFTVKSLLFICGGAFLAWKGIVAVFDKMQGSGHEHTEHLPHLVHSEGRKFWRVVTMIIIINLLFSLDSTLVVVGMTDIVPIMIGSVIISMLVFLVFAQKMCDFLSVKPEFEMLGLCLLVPIGAVLVQEGAHDAHLFFFGYHVDMPSQGWLTFIVVFVFIAGWLQDIARVKREKRESCELPKPTKEPVHPVATDEKEMLAHK